MLVSSKAIAIKMLIFVSKYLVLCNINRNMECLNLQAVSNYTYTIIRYLFKKVKVVKCKFILIQNSSDMCVTSAI